MPFYFVLLLLRGKKPWYPGWPHSWCECFGEEKYNPAPDRNQTMIPQSSRL